MKYDDFLKLMDEYQKKFGEIFPLMCFMGISNDEIAAKIKACLKSGKPYEPPEGLIF